MDPVTIAKLWLAIRPIKRWKERRKAKGEVMKGKLTYSAIGVMAIIYLGQLIGVEVAEEQAASIVGVIAGLIGAYGRWRATKTAA